MKELLESFIDTRRFYEKCLFDRIYDPFESESSRDKNNVTLGAIQAFDDVIHQTFRYILNKQGDAE